MPNSFKHSNKKSIKDRIEVLKNENLFEDSLNQKTDEETFNHIIENFVTTYELGLGISPDFLIDDKYYHIPMVTEEPSVVAGATHAAKIIERNGGFKIKSVKRQMIGQIIFRNVVNFDELNNLIKSLEPKLHTLSKEAHPNIYQFGGGVTEFRFEQKAHNFACLYVVVNTKDAMGANTVNTILEYLTQFFRNEYKLDILMSILSNLATESVVTATTKIKASTLKDGLKTAQKIHDASLYAKVDPYRATTHNKGIMNGVTALMLATGNDTRAVEAGAHAFASISGKYQPLATWELVGDELIGSITLPLNIGVVGGSMNLLPKVKLSRKILGITTATELMKVAACLGLAQNFAALYALTTDGINKGHMKLHARNVALEAGALKDQVEDVVNHLIKTNSITKESAINYLKSIKK